MLFKMNNKIYTLIRPVLDYEESETTFAAFLTREAAESARQEIIDFWNNAKKKIGEEPEWESDEEWKVYKKWDIRRDEIMGKLKWPYKSKEAILFDFRYSWRGPDEFIQISEVPLF